MFQELRKKNYFKKIKINMAVKKGLRRLTWFQSFHSFETEIKSIFLINKNAIIGGTKKKINGACGKNLIFRSFFQN